MLSVSYSFTCGQSRLTVVILYLAVVFIYVHFIFVNITSFFVKIVSCLKNILLCTLLDVMQCCKLLYFIIKGLVLVIHVHGSG